MKKRIIAIAITLTLFAALVPVSVSAASASARLSGPDSVRAGDTITVSFVLSGSGIYGASGTLSYDGLTLVSTSQSIGSPWIVEFNGNNFAAYDNNLTSPINSSATLFTAKFKVKDLSPGASISVSCQSVKATDGTADAQIGTVKYSATVAAPLSSENNLKSLTVSNATISPAFSSGTTSYTAQVPFDVSRLNVAAVAEDSKASVSVNSPTLTPNATTNVTITVKAENGAKKTYTIAVKRAQDPNYVPSSNSKLTSITVDGFLLSPVFSQDKTQYMVWLPYEVDSVSISGTAEDALASVQVEGGDSLKAGADNPVKVICTAEDGSKTVYTVTVKRAQAHDPSLEPTEPETEPTTAPTEETTVPPTTEAAETQESSGSNVGITILLVVLAFAVGTACGFLVDYLIRKRKTGK